MQKEKEFIDSVVDAFYQKAVIDIMIGHQFRKIALWDEQRDKDVRQGGHHPLKPPFEAFAHHLPRIKYFWYKQLLKSSEAPENSHPEQPFDLITLHHKLSIRRGELGRWMILFLETLDQQEKLYPEYLEFAQNWRLRVEHFRSIFERKLF